NRLVIVVREFFDEVSHEILNANFATVSVIDLLREGEVKDLLLDAKSALDNSKLPECAIFCRKSIYLELERSYDTYLFKDYKDDRPGFHPLTALGTSAPFFARNKDYIEKNVFDPTDYVVYDHDHLNQELLQYSIDHTAFWNVWRLTPEVYKLGGKQWVVKYDFDKLDP